VYLFTLPAFEPKIFTLFQPFAEQDNECTLSRTSLLAGGMTHFRRVRREAFGWVPYDFSLIHPVLS